MDNPGNFDLWVTNRTGFQVVSPQTGSTGDFDRWITDRIYFDNYAEAVEATGATVDIRGPGRGIMRGVGRGI